MTTSTVHFTEERVKVAGTELYVLKGGRGRLYSCSMASRDLRAGYRFTMP